MESLPNELLELIIRFTASIGDVSLTIESPRTTTGLSLKQLIRKQLPKAYASKRLRLISAGKVLVDTEALSSSLNLALHKSTQNHSQNGKGKQPVRDTAKVPPIKLYIHCSIGDSLSEKELAEESRAAEAADQALLSPPSGSSPVPATNGDRRERDGRGDSASPGPRGFDRLLTTGFTATEVAALRSQFTAILQHTHTSDTMPTGAALLALEDRWLDSDANNAGSGSSAGDAEGETWGVDDGRTLDDFLWGNVFGFFWPIGALVWGFREENVWTRRRQIAVFTGILINLVFGFARLTS